MPGYMPGEVPKGEAWKRPRVKDWRQYQDVLVTDEVFLPWYGPGGEHISRPNMGTICGRASGNLFIIDLDVHKKPEAAAWWEGVVATHNNRMALETAEQRTGGGGRQILFYAPAGYRTPTCKTSIGVDIRGQGGFAVLAPSIHDSGGTYAWLEGMAPWDEAGIMMAPDWLLREIEALVALHGGDTTVHRTTSGAGGNGAAYDGFGHQTDLREQKMTELVWGAVLDLYRTSPIKPDPVAEAVIVAEKYQVYEDQVAPRQYDPALSKAEMLDREGRGRGLFHVKWQYAMRQWNTKVAEEAGKPGKDKFGTDKTEAIVYPSGTSLILTSAEFLAGYTPPAYLIDDVIQRGYLYSLTARTGHGKTAVALYMAQAIARGVDMHGCKVLPGTVLILAGENPDDVRARYFVLGHTYGFDPTQAKIRWIPGVKHLPSHMDIIRKETDEIDDLVLVLVDTAAAYFPGTETNSNSEQGEYARLLRQMTFLKNKPAVIALSHPVKNASKDNLLPMGGSAFLNEVDGNLTLWAGVDRQTTLHWQGKFRGPEFDPMTFELVEEHCTAVKNEAGVLLPSVVAKPMAEVEVEAAEDRAEQEENSLMRAMYGAQAASFTKLADQLGWKKRRVQRLMERLDEGKFVEQKRNKKYMLTNKGTEAIGGLKIGHRHD